MLARIYRDHRQGLYSLALAVTRHTQMAEDAVHDAFTRLCRVELSPDRDPVPYVFKAVRNAALDQIRRRQRASQRGDSLFDTSALPDPGTLDTHRAVETAERDALVREAVDRLPDDERELITMKLYAGLTFRQIAESLAQPLATVASRYRRTLTKLRSDMESLV
ncbi:MAG: sigma-70 family RNA polymerase sigma factor [Phycisphaerae bacterium]|nr:sigma-70 family RNA polymerase sigma factor [Phycisphaerae bacterium]